MSRSVPIALARQAAGDRIAIAYRSTPPAEGFLPVQYDTAQDSEVGDAFLVIAKNRTRSTSVSNAGPPRTGSCSRFRERLHRRSPTRPLA